MTFTTPVTAASELPDSISLLLIENDLVDEMALTRAVAELALPYQVMIARSVTEARSILAGRRFDVILTDYNLCDGTSFDLAEAFVDQVVIFVTGSGNEEIAAEALRLGAHDYLIKDTQCGYLKLLPSRIELALRQKRLIQQLHESEAQLRDLFDSTNDLIHSIAPDGHILFVNRAWREVLGYSAEEVTTLNIFDVIHPDYHEYCRTCLQRHLAGEGIGIVETAFQTKAGQVVIMEGNVTVRFEHGQPVAVRGIFRDMTERKRVETELRIAATAFDAHDAIMITDADGTIIRTNLAFQKVTGYSQEEVLGKSPRILNSDRQNAAFYDGMWNQLLSTGSWSGEIWNRHKSGRIYPEKLTITAVKNDSGETIQYVTVFSDISARKQAEDAIHSLIFYDALTELPNRSLLIDCLQQALSTSMDNQHYGAVLFLDMDKFKALNDTLGHVYGDQLLIEIGKRIKRCVHNTDTASRFGGDEFGVLLEGLGTNEAIASQKAANVAEKIREALAQPYLLEEHEYHTSSSIGVVLFCGNEVSADELLKHADAAMYQAKDAGRNTVRFFDPSMQQAVEARIKLEADLHHAASDKQLHLYYQIQMDSDKRPIGAEALIRWIHPERGLVPPLQFIPAAEESILILEIGQWVLDTACHQLAVWGKNEQTRGLTLAINVSARQFHNHDFVKTVAAALQTHRIEPSRLKLELTESIIVEGGHALEQLYALRALGVRLSLDDFGTGYSSLAYLKKLPLDQLKIDQSFVRDISTDTSDAIMVKTIIAMAHNFSLNIIAEGVETESQLTFLRKNGCMAYQGYLFGRPVPIEEFEASLQIPH